MPTTPIYGLRYQGRTDQPHGPNLGEHLALDVETELARIDADVAAAQADVDAIAADITTWATYTPTVTGGGSVTWTTRTGRWRRIGPKTVSFIAYFDVNVAGSGALDVQFTTPTAIARTVRQTFTAAHEGGPNLAGLHAVTFTGGTGSTVDRIRYGGDTNLVGADLVAGLLLTVQGVYEEQ